MDFFTTVEASMPKVADLPYARIRPPAPSFIPPK